MRELLNKRLYLAKPNYSNLSFHSSLFVDMHTHSVFSDGLGTIEKIAEKARKNRIGVAITDHNEIRGSLELAKHKDVFSIPGIEISGQEGLHLLIYFYTYDEMIDYYKKHVEPYKLSDTFYILSTPTMKLLEAAKDYHCLISAAHPFGPGATGIAKEIHTELMDEGILNHLDAVEIFNAAILTNHNHKALLFAQLTNYGLTGGSDAHTLPEIGNCLTFANCPRTISAFLDAVLNNETSVIGKESPLLLKPYTKIKTLTNFGRHPVLYSKLMTRMVVDRFQRTTKRKKISPQEMAEKSGIS